VERRVRRQVAATSLAAGRAGVYLRRGLWAWSSCYEAYFYSLWA
jgi:hypothetical protein